MPCCWLFLNSKHFVCPCIFRYFTSYVMQTETRAMKNIAVYIELHNSVTTGLHMASYTFVYLQRFQVIEISFQSVLFYLFIVNVGKYISMVSLFGHDFDLHFNFCKIPGILSMFSISLFCCSSNLPAFLILMRSLVRVVRWVFI